MIWDNWTTGQEIKHAIQKLFEVKKMQIDVLLGGLDRVGHEREFRLVWEDNRRWRYRLDQGFGFMRAVGSEMHRFDESLSRQGGALADAEFEVEPKDPGYLYAYPVE